MNTSIATAAPGQATAQRRALRLALGTTLALAVSQVITWPLGFLASVFAMLLLATPLPAPSVKFSIRFLVALVVPAYACLLLLPVLEQVRLAGILLIMLGLFGAFYFTARGGVAVLGIFMTMGITIVVTVGSVSSELALMVVNAIAVNAFIGIAFVMLAHALLPDLSPRRAVDGERRKAPKKPKPPQAESLRNTLRALTVMLPLVVVFLFSASSISYVPVMMKVASMGQQASTETSRALGVAQLESTIWGGIGALAAWQVMRIWPSLLLFCLLIALACLVFGARIFQGAALHPKGSMWSYALLTMIILITPAVADSPVGGDVAASFYSRLLLFLGIAVYGTVSVAVFDAFWPRKPARQQV